VKVRHGAAGRVEGLPHPAGCSHGLMHPTRLLRASRGQSGMNIIGIVPLMDPVGSGLRDHQGISFLPGSMEISA